MKMRGIGGLPGSSLFPNWTRDGRLFFRYDAADFRGFACIDHPLDWPERPLPSPESPLPAARTWTRLFPAASAQAHDLSIVLIWAPWSAHSPFALQQFQLAKDALGASRLDVGAYTSLALTGNSDDAAAMLRRNAPSLPLLRLDSDRFMKTEAVNQIPSLLLFDRGRLVG